MRLIDADEFKRQVAAAAIKNGLNESVKKGTVLMELIDMQPTAYDADKVVEQLRENDNICSSCLNRNNSIAVCATFCDIGERLKIVKAGGVNE